MQESKQLIIDYILMISINQPVDYYKSCLLIDGPLVVKGIDFQIHILPMFLQVLIVYMRNVFQLAGIKVTISNNQGK